MLGSHPFKLVPIMVGSTNIKSEEDYGKILAPYFDDENTIFCVSSDFCHWVFFFYQPLIYSDYNYYLG